MRVLISGGPGSGCTSTAKVVGAELGLPVFDSDTFFHKPTDPPFQEQYSRAERKQLLEAALEASPEWILSGSISSWGVELAVVQFGVFLDIPKDERLRRLECRERGRFGSRIDIGGDLYTENNEFMEWASAYEDRSGIGRNRIADLDFLKQQCEYCMQIGRSLCLDEVASKIGRFLANPTKA